MQNQDIGVAAIILAISILVILLTVSFIAAILILYQKRQFFHLREVNKLKLSYEKEMLKLNLEIQEQTFENISLEIHDNVGQVLTLAKFHLNLIDTNNLEKANVLLRNSVNLLSEAISDLSDISRSLSSEIVSNNGLIRALEFEFERINHLDSIHIEFLTTGDPIEIDSRSELVVFRIVQEALNNAVRHSLASVVQVNFHYFINQLHIEVIDNGKGINFETLNRLDFKVSAGMRNMEKRTKTLNGKFEVDSISGMGTKINIWVPFNY